MAARKVRWAPREPADLESRDPLRWCKIGRHVTRPYRKNPPAKICTVCKAIIEQ